MSRAGIWLAFAGTISLLFCGCSSPEPSTPETSEVQPTEDPRPVQEQVDAPVASKRESTEDIVQRLIDAGAGVSRYEDQPDKTSLAIELQVSDRRRLGKPEPT